MDPKREDRDERALVLFHRMLNRRPVWVDSPATQMVWLQSIGIDEDGEVVAFDQDGNDHRADEYMLEPR